MADGIEIPVIVPDDGATVTLEKLAAQVIELADANQKLQDAQKAETAATKSQTAGLAILGGAVAGIAQVITTKLVTGLGDLARAFTGAIAEGSKLSDLSLQFNTSAESLQRLGALGAPVGVSLETIAGSMNRVNRTLANSGPAFRKFGLDVQELGKLDTAERFEKIARTIKAIDDPTKQAAASFELLKDRSGTLLKVIRDLDGGAEEAKNAFGTIIPENLVQGLDDFGDRLDLLNKVIKSFATNLVAPIANSTALREVLKLATEELGRFSKSLQDNQKSITDWVNKAVVVAADALVFFATGILPPIIDGLTGLALVLNPVRILLQALFEVIKFGTDITLQFLLPALQATQKALAGDFAGAWEIARKAAETSVEGQIAATKKLFSNLADLGAGAGASFGKIVDANIRIQNTAATAGAAIGKLRDRIAEAGKAQADLVKAPQEAGGFEESIEQAEQRVQGLNKALEQGLALFQKQQQLASIQATGNDSAKRIAAAKQEVAFVEEEFRVREAILQNQIRLDALKGGANAAALQAELKGLRDIFAVNREIAKVKEERAVKADRTTSDIVIKTLETEKSLFALKQQGLAIDDRKLTGVKLLEAQQKRELKALEENFRIEVQILETKIKQAEAERQDVTGLKQDLERLKSEHALRVDNLNATQAQDKALEKMRETARKVNDALDLAGQAAAALAGTEFGDFIGGLLSGAQAAFNLGQGLKEAINTAGSFGELDFGQKLQAIGAGVQTAVNIFQQNRRQLSGAQGALSGATSGASFGAAFGPIGAGVGAVVGGLIGFFAGSKFRKIAKEAGKVLGEGISKETVEAIETSMKELDLSAGEAALLHISDAIADTGKSASEFGTQVNSLMEGIASGAIPAEEGLAEVGEVFTQIADEAIRAGRVGDRTLTNLIRRSRELGIDSPEITAFVNSQVERATAGVAAFVNSLSALSGTAIEKIGADAGLIFGAAFAANVEQFGIVAAVDSMSESFETLRETLGETLDEAAVNAILGPFAAAFNTINDENLRPLFEGIDGLSQAMQGLANSAFLTIDQFNAIGRATGTLFDEAIAAGADQRTALLAVAPAIQAAITAAEQFGIPLDADTQRLKELAEANGIAFKTDPMERAAEAIETLAIALDKAFNLGLGLEEQFNSIAVAATGAADATGAIPEKLGEIPEDFREGIRTAGGGGLRGGAAGPPGNLNIVINAELGIQENPLVAAETLQQVRAFSVEAAVDALSDRIPGIVASIRSEGPEL